MADDRRLQALEKRKRALREANFWQKLPEGDGYQNSKFEISIAHSKAPMLCRAGQKTCGGQNYWNTEGEFNAAILEVIVDEWENIWPLVQSKMEHKEAKALKDCQEFIDELQAAINNLPAK